MLTYITAVREQDYDKLVRIWYRAVRETHHFLAEADFEFFHLAVKDGALRSAELYAEVDETGEPVGFIGVEGSKIDTLFVDPEHFGTGVGRRLVAHIAKLKGERLQVDVNEQNDGAYQFYVRCGFRQVGRSELDDSGKPYPLIHMEKTPSLDFKQSLIDSYNKLAPDYEKHVDTDSGHNAYYERPAMVQLLPSDLSRMKVLDAGCAAGWYTDYLLQRGADVTAIDFSSSMVEACRRRIGGRGTALVHDLSEPLPFPDASFDLILSSLTLHYIKDWTPVFQEFRRVLKPGATLLYSIHHPFMERQADVAGNYFATERITETWNKQESGPVEVSFFTRPLGEIVNTTASCFRIRRMLEPQPVMGDMNNPQYRSWHDKWFQRLSTQPHFLIVQADKMESGFELLN